MGWGWEWGWGWGWGRGWGWGYRGAARGRGESTEPYLRARVDDRGEGVRVGLDPVLQHLTQDLMRTLQLLACTSARARFGLWVRFGLRFGFGLWVGVGVWDRGRACLLAFAAGIDERCVRVDARLQPGLSHGLPQLQGARAAGGTWDCRACGVAGHAGLSQ